MPSSPYKIETKWIPVTGVRAVDDYNYEVQLENSAPLLNVKKRDNKIRLVNNFMKLPKMMDI